MPSCCHGSMQFGVKGMHPGIPKCCQVAQKCLLAQYTRSRTPEPHETAAGTLRTRPHLFPDIYPPPFRPIFQEPCSYSDPKNPKYSKNHTSLFEIRWDPRCQIFAKSWFFLIIFHLAVSPPLSGAEQSSWYQDTSTLRDLSIAQGLVS